MGADAAPVETSTQPGIIDGVVVAILGMILIAVTIILIICCCCKKKDKSAAVHPDDESTAQSDASSKSSDTDSDPKTAPKEIVVESSSNINSNAKPVQAFSIPKDDPGTKLAVGHQQKPEHRQKSPGPKPTEKESKADMLKGIDDDVEKEWENAFPFVEVDPSTGRIKILKPILCAKSKTEMKPESNFVLRQVAKTPKGLENVSEKSGLPLAHFPVERHTNCTDVKKCSDQYQMNLNTNRYYWVPKILHCKYSNKLVGVLFDLEHTMHDQ